MFLSSHHSGNYEGFRRSVPDWKQRPNTVSQYLNPTRSKHIQEILAFYQQNAMHPIET
jgi:hypothetical protein